MSPLLSPLLSPLQWIVLLGGIALVAAIQGWFFFSGKKANAATTSADGAQTMTIAVSGGYSPAVVEAKAGQPLRLVFDRQENNACSEEIVLPDFGVRRFLPPFEKTEVELTPEEPGTYELTCGMSMLRGRLVVRGSEMQEN